MNVRYTDNLGHDHKLEIFVRVVLGERVFMVQKDGDCIAELICDSGRWSERYAGVSELAGRFGFLIESAGLHSH